MAEECSRCPDPGMCCRWLELQIVPLAGDEMKWVELHPGVRIVEHDDAVFVRIDIPCGALQPDGSCGVYGTPLRPKLCGEWPVAPLIQARELRGCVFLTEAIIAAETVKG